MRNILKNGLLISIGTLAVAVSLNLFLVPADIAPGGLSGIAIILHHLFSLPVGLSILVLNIPIFLWCLKHFPVRYVFSSLLGMGLLAILTDSLAWITPVTSDSLLSALYGGGIMGAGLGLVFKGGSTTGGTDIVAQILKKRFPSVSVGRFVLIIDSFIVILAGLTFRKWEVTLYSAVALCFSTYIIDLMVEGIDFAKVAYIISDNPEAISQKISSSLTRGTTALYAYSHYTETRKTVLMCVVKKYEITKLKKIIKSTDPTAFVILSDTREVLGNGFKTY